MSTVTNNGFKFGRLVAGALIAGTLTLSAAAAFAAGQTPVGVSEPGYLPQARALLRSDRTPLRPAEVQTKRTPTADDRPRAAWEDCEAGSYWMMMGDDATTPMLCR